MKQKLIIVTPIYEDNDSAEKLLSELKSIYKGEVFIVAVDDGSLVNPFNVNFLKRLSIEGVVLELKKKCWSSDGNCNWASIRLG